MKGITYFHTWGFSINEGRYPTVALQWRPSWFFYCAFRIFGRRFSWCFG